VKRTTLLLMLIATGAAEASYVIEDTPTWRGDANTRWYEWESFTSASHDTGPNFPGNEAFPSGEALLFNFGAGAVISGDGNIYGFGGALNMHAYAYTDADVQEVLANVSMHGTEMLYSQVMLVWNDGIEGGAEGFLAGTMSTNHWEEVDYGGGNIGAIANVSWSFDLSGLTADIRQLGLLVQTAGPHSSLDTVSLDIQLASVPAPGGLALLGLAALGRRRRRRVAC
jgi:MYXO-CTERM domain-containing protein